MRVKRVFIAAMFCCYISISRLLQIRSVDETLQALVFFFIVFTVFVLMRGSAFTSLCSYVRL